MKKLITLLTLGTLSVFMQACTSYGDPYYGGNGGYYYQQPSYSSYSVSSTPRPRLMPRVIHTQEPECVPRYQKPRIYEPYSYQVYDHRSNTSFNIQDRRRWIEKGNCYGGAEPTFFYNVE